MPTIPQNISQDSDSGPDESFFPDDYHGDDSFNVTEFEHTDDFHNKSHRSRPSNASNLGAGNDRNYKKLDTISERNETDTNSVASNELLPENLRFSSTKSKTNSGANSPKKKNKDSIPKNVLKERQNTCYNAEIPTLFEGNSFSNMTFKSGNQMLDHFEADQHRVENENFLHRDQITESMLIKKQHSWEPSIYSPSKINQEYENSKLKDLNSSEHLNCANKSLGDEKSKLGKNKSSVEKNTLNVDVKVPEKSSLAKEKRASKTIPLDENKNNMFEHIQKHIASLNEPRSKKSSSQSNKSMADKSLPTIVESNTTTVPISQLDINNDMNIDRFTSSPTDSDQRNLREDLSNMCKNLSEIPLSPKFRPKTKVQLEPNNGQSTLNFSLTSSAIDDALKYNKTVASNDTAMQMNLVDKIRIQKFRKEKTSSAPPSLEDLRRQIKAQIDSSKNKKRDSTQIRTHSSNVEHSSHSIPSKHIRGVPTHLYKKLTPTSRSPKNTPKSSNKRKNLHSLSNNLSNQAMRSQTLNPFPNTPSTSTETKIEFIQPDDETERGVFTIPYVSIKTDLRHHAYLKKTVFSKNAPIVKILAELVLHRPENQLEFITQYLETLKL